MFNLLLYISILNDKKTKRKSLVANFSIFAKKNDKKSRKTIGGTHTLHNSGIIANSKKKDDEYFGGDSTVTHTG